jgi:glycosyltransferase involved in cell wall biosynthesis
MKIAIVTCYDQNDYIRARTLRTAFAAAEGVEAIIVRNRHKGLLRYIEVPLKLTWMRLRRAADAYVVTFRGYEMLLFMTHTFWRKPIIFDELVNFAEYWREKGVIRPDSPVDHWARRWYGRMLRKCRLILADTKPHAELSSILCEVDERMYRVIPIGADEALFHPGKTKHPAKRAKGKPFEVFYYGNGMTPLHGLQYVLDAALHLKHNPDITFTLVGGHGQAEQACNEAISHGARITYLPWVPFEEIPKRARAAGLCLGGPFGRTTQSQFVVTGKTAQFLACQAPALVAKNRVGRIFKDRKNCLLVPQADSDAIVEAIEWASAHPKQLTEIAAEGRKLYERHFSQALINGLVQEIVKELQHGRSV